MIEPKPKHKPGDVVEHKLGGMLLVLNSSSRLNEGLYEGLYHIVYNCRYQAESGVYLHNLNG